MTTAVRTSEALFDSAQLVVVAGEGDPGAVLLGASTAVGLGVPLLIEPQSATPGADPVGDELERLGAVTVLGVGAVSDHPGRDVVGVPANAAELERVTGLRFGSADPVAPGAEASAVARLEPGSPVALLPEGGVAPPSPRTRPPGRCRRCPAPRRSATPWCWPPEGPSRSPASRPHARPAPGCCSPGEPPIPAPRRTWWPRCPRPGGEGRRAGAGLRRGGGARLEDPDRGRRGRTARRRAAALPGRLLVALYGQPGTPALGVLGEQGLDGEHRSGPGTTPPRTSRWSTAVVVVPTFEIIATVASAGPGPDGNYSAEADPEVLRPVGRGGGGGRHVRPAGPAARPHRLPSPRPSATGRCWSCRTSGWPSTRSGGWARTRCTCGRSAPSASTR